MLHSYNELLSKNVNGTSELDANFTNMEIQYVVKNLKDGKATGLDWIKNEILKMEVIRYPLC